MMKNNTLDKISRMKNRRSTKIHIKTLSISGFFLFLTACTHSPGVTQLSDNYFMMSNSNIGFNTTQSVAKSELIKEANAHCKSKNKLLEVTKITTTDRVPFRYDAHAEIEFTCIRY